MFLRDSGFVQPNVRAGLPRSSPRQLLNLTLCKGDFPLSEFFEIAYAAASCKLCLFTGTGFSKAVTGNEAPSWQGLLESICDITPNPVDLKAVLSPRVAKAHSALKKPRKLFQLNYPKLTRIFMKKSLPELEH